MTLFEGVLSFVQILLRSDIRSESEQIFKHFIFYTGGHVYGKQFTAAVFSYATGTCGAFGGFIRTNFEAESKDTAGAA